jgi:cell wall-associated NlpC family hydrolase
MAINSVINVSVANLYRKPDYDSEVVSQALLGERVAILEDGPLFCQIRQVDNYESWISSDQVCNQSVRDLPTARVRQHFLRIYHEPSVHSVGVREAVVGCCLPIAAETDAWYEVVLPDGVRGWAERWGFGDFPSFSPENIVELAREFLGYQYVWGGRSPKGFDCSGFVQTVFGLTGIPLPRDAWQQQRHHLVSLSWQDAQPGDLLFFGKTPEKVTHVGIATGQGSFLHASGWVRANSLDEAGAGFSRKHLDTFISVNRYGREVEK